MKRWCRDSIESYNVARASWLNNFNNNSNFNANDRNINNNNCLRGIIQRWAETLFDMAIARNLWQELCSSSNLELAFKKARKHKTIKPYVIEFEADLKNNLLLLRTELLFHSYCPKPLKTFILHDPKTRKISKSDFRDRIIHHALCNIIEPLFEKLFIFDSYANRKGKGTLKAIERFDHLQRRVSQNYQRSSLVLKADIRHYFDEVDHTILLTIIQRKIKDPKVVWLIKRILDNYCIKEGKGMPLGNLTSQFFANIYLNEFDQFVKHQLKAKYYIRYVDDFAIFDCSPTALLKLQEQITIFLDEKLSLSLHPDKTKIVLLYQGVEFLGFKIFPRYRLLKKRNMRCFIKKSKAFYESYSGQQIEYDDVYNFMEGWCAHAKHANTFSRRQKILISFEDTYSSQISTKEINRFYHCYQRKTNRKMGRIG